MAFGQLAAHPLKRIEMPLPGEAHLSAFEAH